MGPTGDLQLRSRKRFTLMGNGGFICKNIIKGMALNNQSRQNVLNCQQM